MSTLSIESEIGSVNLLRPVPISPVKVETEEERRLFERGERNSKERKELGKTSLMKHTPNDEESDLIHAMWQRQLQYHGRRSALPIETDYCDQSYIRADADADDERRPKRPTSQTRERSFHGCHKDPNGGYHAAPVP